MKPLRIASFAGSGLAAVLVAGLLVYASSSESVAAAAGSAPAATAPTSIADCVVTTRQEVIIGGPLAKAACKGEVVMVPDPGAEYREIYIARGGELLISAGAGGPNVANEPPVGIVCIGDGGTVRAGSKDKPVDNGHRFRITFFGTPTVKDDHQDSPCYGFSKGIDLTTGGSLLLYGAEGVPGRGGVSWTTLASPAGTKIEGAKFEPPAAGTTTLNLTADVGAGPNPWHEGDWIAVATTTYTPFETEFVQVKTVTEHDTQGCAMTTQGCSTVTLEPGEGLKYYHFGSLPPSPANKSGCTNPRGRVEAGFLCDGKNQNYGVDERAEVGLISRDIELTAKTFGNTDYWGGEIMIHRGFAHVAIQGVRISKFGKDQLGSYPLHFHKVGDIAKPPNPGTADISVNADSVDHSYNKCVTIHETSNLTIANLVCARIVGHIFYEELGSWNEDNVADDSGIVFKDDLGLGASSNSFDINATSEDTRQQLIDEYWWAGDNMTNSKCTNLGTCIGYDGFNIPDTDNQAQWAGGSCTHYEPTSEYLTYVNPNPGPGFEPCSQREGFNVYIEPASGFWIQNPDTALVGDAIAGCQGVGRGVWWVIPGSEIDVDGARKNLKFDPLGKIDNIRVSGCYAGLYDEPDDGVHGEQLFPRGGKQASAPVIATLDGVTATRNRFRGVWLRPTWFVLNYAHLASNLQDVTLLTSGGPDGNYPGVWQLVENSAIVGLSANNVERWGLCPKLDEFGPGTGASRGCISLTNGGADAHSGERIGKGYPIPERSAFGYMIYDGPVLVFHDRFVNFNYNEAWTQDGSTGGNLPCNGTGWALYAELDRKDCRFLQGYEKAHGLITAKPPVPQPWVPSPYEGDAAFGWFDSNQSEYPTATASKDLMWTNTTLRHQIFTHYVSVSNEFADGDQNTAIIDDDGTLSGLAVRSAPNLGTGAHPVHAISLNNLPLNGSSNSVEECKSLGAQNMVFEGRDTSLMSPGNMGSLEFSDLYPFLKTVTINNKLVYTWTCDNKQDCVQSYPGIYPHDNITHWQDVTFTRDDAVPASGTYHPAMTLGSRNGQGMWEPKVTNGYGYTIGVKPTTAQRVPPEIKALLQQHQAAGIWPWINVGLVDIVDPNISPKHPFFVRVGICYSDRRGGTHPQGNDIFEIKRGYKSWGNNASNIWKDDPVLEKSWTGYANCHDLDTQDANYANVPWSGDGFKAGCPAAAAPVTQLRPASSIAELGTSTKPVFNRYYYNPQTGMLYLNVAQILPNAPGSSPSGSCANGNHDPACQSESYYICPKVGCPVYTIQMTKAAAESYEPGKSTCTPDPNNLMAPPPQTSQNQLVLADQRETVIERSSVQYDLEGEPYFSAVNGPECPATTQTSTNAAPMGPR